MRAVLFAIALAACAGPATQLRRDNAALDRELQAARADLRKERRKNEDLSTENLVLRDKLGTKSADGVPKLPVEVMQPDTPPAPASDPPPATSTDDLGADAKVVGVEDDGTEIVYVGDAANGKSVPPPTDDEGDDLQYAPDDADVAAPDPSPAPPRKHHHDRAKVAATPAPAPARSSAAAAAYAAAVAKVKAHDHDGAIADLRAFLDAYPRDDLADNAQYWLGEVYYDEKDWARSLVEFRAVVETYPKGNKVPDALLKMGYCFESLEQTAKARDALQQVVDTFPGTEPAQLAAVKLKELK